MSTLVPYLIFSGTCKEAMEFYRDALDGEILFMHTFGESPIPVDEEAQHRIFNSELRAGNIRIKASDDMPGHRVTTGTNFSMFVSFSNAQAKAKVFSELSEGGKVLFPIEDNFGMVEDKYGIRWMLEHGEQFAS